MRHVGSNNATHYVPRFLTAPLGIPLAIEGGPSGKYGKNLTRLTADCKNDDSLVKIDNISKS